MTTFTDTIQETFKVVSCYTCGVRFAITSELYRRVVTDAAGSIFCPACGSSTCWKKSEAQKQIEQLEAKLKWEMENSERRLSEKNKVEAELRAAQLTHSKIKKRISSGVCPCCNRTFKQLAAHMSNKHPEFKPKK